MDFTGLFEMQLMLFIVMLIGVYLRKNGMISEEGKK